MKAAFETQVGVTELPYQIKPKQYLGGDEFVVAFNDLLAMNSWDVGLVATEAWRAQV